MSLSETPNLRTSDRKRNNNNASPAKMHRPMNQSLHGYLALRQLQRQEAARRRLKQQELARKMSEGKQAGKATSKQTPPEAATSMPSKKISLPPSEMVMRP